MNLSTHLLNDVLINTISCNISSTATAATTNKKCHSDNTHYAVPAVSNYQNTAHDCSSPHIQRLISCAAYWKFCLSLSSGKKGYKINQKKERRPIKKKKTKHTGLSTSLYLYELESSQAVNENPLGNQTFPTGWRKKESVVSTAWKAE